MTLRHIHKTFSYHILIEEIYKNLNHYESDMTSSVSAIRM